MAGSGGKGYFGETTPNEVARITREAQEKVRDQEFEQNLTNFLREQLTEYNSRDKDRIASILSDMKERIQDAIDESVDLLFGGSIAKNTYLKGLSDVDCLVLVDSSFTATSPSELKDQFAAALKRKYGDKVWVGALAVTVEASGQTIQLLPAIRAGKGVRIGTPDGDEWSRINPQKFAKKLSQSNVASGNKLVPTIKLAKGIIAGLPEGLRPSGYHVESLAINIFRDYAGSGKHQDMLRYFFSKAPEHILKPIKDSTGQSVHVDDSLGPVHSPLRHTLARSLDRISRRIKNADAAQSLAVWKELMGSEVE